MAKATANPVEGPVEMRVVYRTRFEGLILKPAVKPTGDSPLMEEPLPRGKVIDPRWVDREHLEQLVLGGQVARIEVPAEKSAPVDREPRDVETAF